ncbi:hypothetical protein GH714_039909 [Hevea brasiliensis]|uniref:Uncharacterized protein n=1 Tax=Hevea brasiliensis TaxID=3981 RepID=A0A6A6MP14_HEVBR|nr:hypothetical protein GH714_039909 [Hevea brasiliensis]
MYADTGLLLPYMQNFYQDIQQLEDYCNYQKNNASMNNIIQTSTISEYDLGGEGDLFKAPEPIIELPLVGPDPMTAAISMISCGEEVISSQGLKVADIESIQTDQLLSEVFYECKKDLMEKAAIEAPLSEILDIKIPVLRINENQIEENKLLPDAPLPKSVSSGCLSKIEWVQGAAVKPNFLDFSGVDLGTVYGMRRAYSEGDIKTLGNGNMGVIHSPLDRPLIISSCTTEDRREKLSSMLAGRLLQTVNQGSEEGFTGALGIQDFYVKLSGILKIDLDYELLNFIHQRNLISQMPSLKRRKLGDSAGQDDDSAASTRKKRKLNGYYPLNLLGEVATRIIPFGLRGILGSSNMDSDKGFAASWCTKVSCSPPGEVESEPKSKARDSTRANNRTVEVSRPPLVRTTRGRVQVLPSRFNDSVIDSGRKESKISLRDYSFDGDIQSDNQTTRRDKDREKLSFRTPKTCSSNVKKQRTEERIGYTSRKYATLCEEEDGGQLGLRRT